MLKEKSKANYSAMQLELEGLGHDQNVAIDVTKESIRITRNYLELLNTDAQTIGFSSTEEEIWFNKTEQPRFHSLYIYYSELFKLLIAISSLSPKSRKKHCVKNLEYINHFFRTNEFHYQYFKLEAQDLDHRYFLSCSQDSSDPSSAKPLVDNGGVGQLFSQFIAFEMLTRKLMLLIENKTFPHKSSKTALLDSEFKWTGDQIDLIELIYALHSSGKINEGKASLVKLTKIFEQLFQVNLDNYFRRFTDVKRRKGMSKTRFLDQLKLALLKKIDDDDAYIAPMQMR